MRQIWKTEGLRGFYAALDTTLVRAVPSCAVTFTTYELIKRELNRRGIT